MDIQDMVRAFWNKISRADILKQMQLKDIHFQDCLYDFSNDSLNNFQMTSRNDFSVAF